MSPSSSLIEHANILKRKNIETNHSANKRGKMTNPKPGLAINFEKHVLGEESDSVPGEQLLCYEIPVSEFLPSATTFGDMKDTSKGRSRPRELFQMFWALIHSYRESYKIELAKYIRRKKKEIEKNPLADIDISALEMEPKEGVRVFLEVIPGTEDEEERDDRRLLFNGKKDDEEERERKNKFHQFGMEEGEPVTAFRFWVFQTNGSKILNMAKELKVLLRRNKKEYAKRYKKATSSKDNSGNVTVEPFISPYEEYIQVTDLDHWADLAAYYTKESEKYEKIKEKGCDIKDKENDINNPLHPNCIFSLQNVFQASFSEVNDRKVSSKFSSVEEYIKLFARRGIRQITFPDPFLVVRMENTFLTPKAMSLLNLPNFQVTYKDIILNEVGEEVEMKIKHENKRRINMISTGDKDFLDNLMIHSGELGIEANNSNEDEFEEPDDSMVLEPIVGNVRENNIWNIINKAYGCGTMRRERIEKAIMEHEKNTNSDSNCIRETNEYNGDGGEREDNVPIIRDYSEEIDISQSISYMSMLDQALLRKRYPRILETISKLLKKRKAEFMKEGDMESWNRVRRYALKLVKETFIISGSSDCDVDQRMIKLFMDGELLNDVQLNMNYHDEGYSVFGHHMIWWAQKLESDQKIFNLHVEIMKAFAAAFDVTRREFNLHINIVYAGDKNAGKSHIGSVLKKALPEGVVIIKGYFTAKAGYDNVNRNFVITFINEGPLHKMKEGDLEVNLKDTLTEQRKVAEVIEYDSYGRRTTKLYVSECIGVLLICSNAGLSGISGPLLSRFVAEEMVIKTRPDKTLPGLKEAENNPGPREGKQEEFHGYTKRHFLMRWLVELFIYEGLLAKPSMRVIDHILSIMTENGNFIIDPRLAHFIKYTVRSYVLTNAILLVFDAEGAIHHGKKFELSQLFDLEYYLCDSVEIAVFVLGLFEKQITQNKELLIEIIHVLQRMAKQEQEKCVGGTSYKRKFVRNTIPYSSKNITGNRHFPSTNEFADRNYIVIPGSIYQIAQRIVDDMEKRNKGKVSTETVKGILFSLKNNTFVNVEVEPLEPMGVPLPDDDGMDIASSNQKEKKKERLPVLEQSGGKEKSCYLLAKIVDADDHEIEEMLGLRQVINMIKTQLPDKFTNEKHKILYGSPVSSDMPYIFKNIRLRRKKGKKTVITDCGFVPDTARFILDGEITDGNTNKETISDTGVMEVLECSVDDYFTMKYLKSIGVTEEEMKNDRIWAHKLGRILVGEHFDRNPEKRGIFTYPEDCIREANIIHLILMLKNETSSKKNYYKDRDGELVFYIEKTELMDNPQYENIIKKWRTVRTKDKRKKTIRTEEEERGIEIKKATIDKFRKSPVIVDNPKYLIPQKGPHSEEEGDSMDDIIRDDDYDEEDSDMDFGIKVDHVVFSPPPMSPIQRTESEPVKEKNKKRRGSEREEKENSKRAKLTSEEEGEEGDRSFVDDEGISYLLEVMSEDENDD